MKNKIHGKRATSDSEDGGESEEHPEDMMDLSHGTFDHEINFAENMLQDMEVEVNEAIKKLKGQDLRDSSSPTAVYQSSAQHESIDDQEGY